VWIDWIFSLTFIMNGRGIPNRVLIGNGSLELGLVSVSVGRLFLLLYFLCVLVRC
jgi:hypothetical protein